MINLYKDGKVVKPDKLAENEECLLNNYKLNKNAIVWREPYIMAALEFISNGKCAYCEDYANPMEVEHYFCKSKYSHLVVDWENLLPVCHRCNKTKGTHDCGTEPIINPRGDIPKEHIYYEHGRLHSISSKGRATIECLKLNCTDKFGKARLRIKEEIKGYFAYCINLMKNSGVSRVDKRELQNCVIDMLKLTRRQNEYSAIYATEILTHPEYSNLKTGLKELKGWNAEMICLEDTAESICLKR